MSEFEVGDRVIVVDYGSVTGLVGRVKWRDAYVGVRLRGSRWSDSNWLLYPRELAHAPSRRAEVETDDAPEVHCYCAKESPLSSYTSSEGHYQEEAE